MSQSLYICLESCTSKPKQLSLSLSCSVWNTAFQIGTQLGVKVNGSDLQNRDLQLPHLLRQPWRHNILCTENNFLKEIKKAKGNRKMFYFSHGTVLAASCPWIFAQWFTFIGELEKLSVRLKIALRQVKMILPGLRSEEMEKEKNTRENKSQSNVNMGRTERSCLSTQRQAENIVCCQNRLDRTHALVHVHLLTQDGHWISSLFINLLPVLYLCLLTCAVVSSPQNKKKKYINI